MKFRNLDLNLLVVFDAMLTYRSTSRASEYLSLTQPAVSNALRRLRAHFDDELFVPLGGQMLPTSLASSLERPIHDLLIQAQFVADMRANFDATTAERTFTLVASDYVSQIFIRPLLQHLSTTAPGICLDVRTITETVDDSFRRGEIDYMLYPQHALIDGHPARSLFTDTFCCAVWDQNPAIADGTLTQEDFLTLKHIVSAHSVSRRPSQTEIIFEQMKLDIKAACFIPGFVQLANFVVGTPHIAVIQSRVARQLPAHLPLKFFTPPVSIPALVENVQWHQHRQKDPATLWMAEQMIQVADTLPDAQVSSNSGAS